MSKRFHRSVKHINGSVHASALLQAALTVVVLEAKVILISIIRVSSHGRSTSFLDWRDGRHS
uniref:Uncharacterized protein n=1 Tax=Utricularia reniformis TaxID=192314 RepID=A0A1Y0B0D2_9LAMI|nr:hypothetical protein AEK19_MT0643 [Utricularia reniformis]ART30896.1 hypothetical protein AEK19_MT0643 [Utricularia reniformis]